MSVHDDIEQMRSRIIQGENATILKLTKKIPEFDIFIKPYDRTLRNKIVHKDLRIDYNNKIVIYSSEKFSFEDLKINTRNLLAIFESVSYIYTFNIRKSLQKGYDLLNREESHSGDLCPSFNR